mgnify:CR=1 FL=1
MRDLGCLSKLSDVEFGIWLSRINMYDLARCISRISPDSQERIQHCQSKWAREFLIEAIESVKGSSIEEIAESEKLLVEALQEE